MNPRTRNLLVALGLTLLVVGFGAVEDWYGQFTYGADGIAYLEQANAIGRGDWSLALSPYWSLGYPLVLAAARWMFPAGWAGDWTSIHVVNLIVYVAAGVAFLCFVRAAATYAARAGGAEHQKAESSLLYVVGAVLFMGWQVQIGNVSRMTPDLMVSGIFFALMAAALDFCRRPTATLAMVMGLLAGFGYVTKAVFLPLSCCVFLTVLVQVMTRPGTNRGTALARFAWVAPAMALAAVPYVVGMSLALGRFTLGEAGGLNYAWTVNNLTHWHWVAGTPLYGEPIHPIRLLCASPPVYEFGWPIDSIYPPFYNPFYWFEGYRHFFSLQNQIAAIEGNLVAFTQTFYYMPHAPLKFAVAIIVLVAAIFSFSDAKIFWRRLLAVWPIYLPSLLGIAIYVVVCLETRYVVGFLLVLVITPLLVLFLPTPLVGKRTGRIVLVLVSLLSVFNMVIDERPFLKRALLNKSYVSEEEWRLGLYFAAHGPPPGTKVAMVKVERGMENTWAYVSGLRVIGQIGDEDLPVPEQERNFHLFIDHPEVQRNVLDLFRKSGAVLVVALDVPGAPQGEGWSQVPGTKAWVHQL